MTWGFLGAYSDEAYAVLRDDWINNLSNVSANGFDLKTLQTDLNQIGQSVAAAVA